MINGTHYFDWDFIRESFVAYFGAELLPEICWESMMAKRKEFPKSCDEEFLRVTCTDENRARLRGNRDARMAVAASLEAIKQNTIEQTKRTQDSTSALIEADRALKIYMKEIQENERALSNAISQLQESANAAIRQMNRGPSLIDTLCAFYLLEHYTNKIKGRP